MVKLQFLGAAGTVTGSRFLVTRTHGGRSHRRTLVDCGMFQGLKELRLRNWVQFPVPPREIVEVILTHAHIDHAGALPLLVKQGFRGPVYCSRPTRDLAKVLLLDAARLQEEDAEDANRRGYSKHHPAQPLFTEREAQEALRHFEVVDTDEWVSLSDDGERFRLQSSGHILGSTFVELEIEEKRILFSGDVGRDEPLLLPPRALVEGADYLVIESTYGGREHPAADPLQELAECVTETHRAGGRLIIPCFAVGRTQEIIHLLTRLREAGSLPPQPIFLDSPLGIAATEIFLKYPHWHRLDEAQVAAMRRMAEPLHSREQSRAAIRREGPAIVLAGSGMLTGGRVLHHLADRLEDPASTILLPGFQAAGTRGRRLLDGEGELKLHGRYFPVRARVRQMASLSAHADQPELLHWLSTFVRVPRETFIVHGESASAQALEGGIGTRLGWRCRVPTHLEEVEL